MLISRLQSHQRRKTDQCPFSGQRCYSFHICHHAYGRRHQSFASAAQKARHVQWTENPVAGLPNPFKGSGEKKPQAPSYQPSIASKPAPAQKQASPGLMKKSASMISSGFKATGKMASASTSFIPGSGKGKNNKSQKQHSRCTFWLAKRNVCQQSQVEYCKSQRNSQRAKVAEVKLPPSTKEMLGGQNGEQHKVASKAFNSIDVGSFHEEKPHQETNLAETNSAGGFYQGAMDKKLTRSQTQPRVSHH